MEDFIGFLRQVYFFRELSDDDVQAVADLSHEQDLAQGTVVFREGDEADRFYILMDGTIEVWKKSVTGQDVLLATEGKGHIFGEMALVDDLPRSATIKALSDIRVLYISREDFTRIMHDRQGVLISVLRSLSGMIRKSNESFIEDLSRRNIELERANRQLTAAQNELIRAERFSNLGKFSSLIIHDLRNPISVIRGYAELLGFVCDEPERVQEYSTKIVQESDRLNSFANELLDYSRGQIRLRLGPVSVPRLFQQIKARVSTQLGKSGIRGRFLTSQGLSLVADEERLIRVLVNLVDNARKASETGGEILVTGKSMAKNRIQIVVEDRGRGMPPEIREKIFEPFFSSSERGGTGLGMVSVKNIVEAHQGSIEVDSELTRGTRVILDLPMRQEKAS
ncbi:ATP-binding protein [Spirochaeta lutea]|uniref:histidine kinase n=1 Tax=Spirochaeta lutea TaxID=1480694 RepID=A0A098R1M8_9SPIO|nr:ATP-binding protein [Spirochaeta lutea]KGE73583.1 hypothetical protein DC28_02705 [Spirochaeta lutea]